MKMLGKIAGGLGLLLVLTSWVTLLATTGTTAFAIKLGVGVGLVLLWAVTNRDRLATWARTTFFYSSSVGLGVVVLIALIAANFIVARRDKTWDLTNKKIYSLAPQTVTTLAGLKEPVRAVSFIPGPAPEAVENLFRRYQAETDKFSWEFRDPRKDPQGAQEYQIRENQPATVLVKGEGATKTHTTISLAKIASAALGEQELTNGIIKLNAVGSQRLYFIQGHGEWPLDPVAGGEDAAAGSLAAVKRVTQDEGYEPQALSLIERGEVPADASAVIIAGPRTRYLAPELKMIADYLDRGGRVVVFVEQGNETGLEPLLAKWGAQLEPGLLADSKVQPDNPYLVVTPFLGDHEITRVLKAQKQPVAFPTARAVTPLKEGTLPGISVTALVLTSPYAWIEQTPTEEPTLSDGEKTGQLTVGVAITRDTKDAPNKKNDEARLVVFGDSDMLSGAFAFDRNLVMNSIAWTTQQIERITIRPPDRDISTIDINAERFSNIRLVAMDLLPMVLMGVGLTIWLTRRAR